MKARRRTILSFLKLIGILVKAMRQILYFIGAICIIEKLFEAGEGLYAWLLIFLYLTLEFWDVVIPLIRFNIMNRKDERRVRIPRK